MEVVYDFETLGQSPETVCAVNIAGIEFDETRFENNPYEYQELIDMAKFMKFDVQEQVEKYGRKVEKGGLEWWKKQDPEVQKQIQPSSSDVSIDKLPDFMYNDLNIMSAKRVWTRGNTFDPVLARSIFKDLGQFDVGNWWAIRDTRSFIEGFTYGTKIFHAFVPEHLKKDFVGHDPIHDVAMDVYRMQYLIRTTYGED